MGITGFQWATLILGVLGFIATWTIGVIGITRAVEAIKHDTLAKVAAASKSLSDEIDAFRAHFLADQKLQDHNFGEVGLSMRQKIADVERTMHEIEIWGRDNFVHIGTFEKVTDRIEEALKDIAAEIKSDFRDLNLKIDGKH